MATTYYVDSAGSNTSPYDTWAKAANKLATIDAIDVLGDTIYVASSHSETTAAAVTLAWAGTVSSPTRIICADKTSGAPPATIATGATVAITGSNTLTLSSGVNTHVYYYGIIFTAGAGAETASISFGAGATRPIFVECSFQLIGTGGGNITQQSNGAPVLQNCTFKVAAAGSGIVYVSGLTTIKGGSWLAGGTTPTNLFVPSGTAGRVTLSNFDLSNLGTTFNFVSTGTSGGQGNIYNCKLPTSWSGGLFGSTPATAARFQMTNSDDANTNYRVWVKDVLGELTTETTIIRTGGANDGATGISWKIVTGTNIPSFANPFVSNEFVVWNDTTGSEKTVTVEILHDSATKLKDSEVWLEVEYLGTSGAPLGTVANDGANILATGSDQAASSATWTTTGMSNPNKQKLSVTFTPQMKGFVHAVVKVAKASYTLYVDPVLTIE